LTDRFSRSMRALLCLGDNGPLADAIWRGSREAGTSRIVSVTFGRVAHPSLRVTMQTNRRKKKKDLALSMVYFIPAPNMIGLQTPLPA
jgi:hypothetical protein